MGSLWREDHALALQTINAMVENGKAEVPSMDISQEQLIYHRGLHDTPGRTVGAKENTLGAFERAIAAGARMIEFDVWEDLKISHDPGNAKAPTLPEALAQIDGRCGVNIEIKSPRMREAALEIVRSSFAKGHWCPEHFVISSFHHETVRLVKKEFCYLQVGAIMDAIPLPGYLDMLASVNIDQVHIEWMNPLMDSECGLVFRNVACSLGMPIWVWTVNDRKTARSALDYGATRLFTDRPDLLLPKTQRHKRS